MLAGGAATPDLPTLAVVDAHVRRRSIRTRATRQGRSVVVASIVVASAAPTARAGIVTSRPRSIIASSRVVVAGARARALTSTRPRVVGARSRVIVARARPLVVFTIVTIIVIPAGRCFVALASPTRANRSRIDGTLLSPRERAPPRQAPALCWSLRREGSQLAARAERFLSEADRLAREAARGDRQSHRNPGPEQQQGRDEEPTAHLRSPRRRGGSHLAPHVRAAQCHCSESSPPSRLRRGALPTLCVPVEQPLP